VSALSEEDVLVALVLRACRPFVTNCYSTEQVMAQVAWDSACDPRRLAWEDLVPRLADEVALHRMAALHPQPIEVAIADSERRLEIEQAERFVLKEAWLYVLGPSRGYQRLDDAVHQLTKAEQRLDVARRLAGGGT
jgi:hypothetical protein